MENIIGTVFRPENGLSPTQQRDVTDGMHAAAAVWQAAQMDRSYRTPRLRPHNRCIYSALAVMDTLRATGRPDAHVTKLGLEIMMLSEHERSRVLVIGDPETPFVKGLWNAHLVVRLGDILIDPTIAQTKRDWNRMPHYAAILANAAPGQMVNAGEDAEALAIAVHHTAETGRDYRIAYFRVPRSVDLRTRNWRSAPDARPEVRAPLVRAAIEIRRSQSAPIAELAMAA